MAERTTTNERRFPILYPPAFRRPSDAPRSIPWVLVAPHAAQAERNHGQTLERLAERGGLAPSELLAVLENRPWHRLDAYDAMRQVTALCEAFDAGMEHGRQATVEELENAR